MGSVLMPISQRSTYIGRAPEYAGGQTPRNCGVRAARSGTPATVCADRNPLTSESRQMHPSPDPRAARAAVDAAYFTDEAEVVHERMAQCRLDDAAREVKEAGKSVRDADEDTERP